MLPLDLILKKEKSKCFVDRFILEPQKLETFTFYLKKSSMFSHEPIYNFSLGLVYK